jgi:hypothetical protein
MLNCGHLESVKGLHWPGHCRHNEIGAMRRERWLAKIASIAAGMVLEFRPIVNGDA